MKSQNTVSFNYAIKEMAANGDKIRQWSAQNDDLLLKSLAIEVIEVAEGRR